MEKPARYTPVFDQDPSRNTASVNAGDFKLYVGGGSINLAFAKALGLRQPNAYAQLHGELLGDMLEAPGQLRPARAGAATSAKKLGLVAAFGRVPAESGGAIPRGPVGAAFVDVFAAPGRPLHPQNVAMLYVVGPKGQGAPGGHGPTVAGRGDFLTAVRAMASNCLLAVGEYNALAESRAGASSAAAEPLPVIRVLQFCLVSGGVYRHPETSKLDVASSIVHGLQRAAEGVEGRSGPLPVVRFAYDEGVFDAALRQGGSSVGD